MPVRNFYVPNLASGGSSEPLTGWQFEYLPWPALVEIGMVHDGAANGVQATVTTGSDTLMEESPVSAGGTDGVFPNDENLDLVDESAAGDRLKIRLRETGAVATTDIMIRVKLTPLI